METPVKAPYAGRVREILVGVNSQVDGGGALLRIDRVESTMRRARRNPDGGVRRRRDRRPGGCARAGVADLAAMRALVMGYDVSAERARSVLDQLRPGALAAADRRRRSCCAPRWTCSRRSRTSVELSRNRPAGEEEESGDERVHSPREYFHSYLHSLDVEREGLPEAFRARLAAVLATLRRHRSGTEHRAGGGGVPGVPGAGARRRIRSRSSPGCWSGGATPGPGIDASRCRPRRRGRRAHGGGDPAAVPGGRRPGQEHPVRGVRAAADRGRPRASCTPTSGSTWQQLAAEPGRRAATPSGSTALVASPEPLIRLLAEQLLTNGPGLRADARGDDPAVLPDPRTGERRASSTTAGPCVTGDFELSGRPAVADLDGGRTTTTCAGALDAINRAGRPGAAAGDVVTDIYLAWPDAPEDGDRVVHAQLQAALQGYRNHRGRPPGHRDGVRRQARHRVQQFTFRPDGPTGWPRSGSSAACTR